MLRTGIIELMPELRPASERLLGVVAFSFRGGGGLFFGFGFFRSLALSFHFLGAFRGEALQYFTAH